VRTVSVEFKAANIDLLRRAIMKADMRIIEQLATGIMVESRNRERAFIDFAGEEINSRNMDERRLTTFTNGLKRAYSAVVLDEVARKQKWMKKEMGQNRYQLQRF
jgi:uncharacterized protein GlcG (DUF336 family)